MSNMRATRSHSSTITISIASRSGWRRRAAPTFRLQLRWYPVVTLLQLTLDMAMATTAPMGYGHVYAPAHYIDAWIEVTDVQGWSPDEIARLKQPAL